MTYYCYACILNNSRIHSFKQWFEVLPIKDRFVFYLHLFSKMVTSCFSPHVYTLFFIYTFYFLKNITQVFYICTNHAAVYIYTFVMGDRFTTIYIYTHCMLVCEKLVRIYGRWLLNHFEYVNHLLAWWFKCVNYHVQYRQQALTIQYCYTGNKLVVHIRK